MTAIENRVRAIIADVLDVSPDNIRPETSLSLADLGWPGLLRITLKIERDFAIELPIEVPSTWASVADVIMATEQALGQARRSAAA